jgi:hypothetical protein
LWLEVFFLAWLALAVTCIMFLFAVDYGRKGNLNLSPAARCVTVLSSFHVLSSGR